MLPVGRFSRSLYLHTRGIFRQTDKLSEIRPVNAVLQNYLTTTSVNFANESKAEEKPELSDEDKKVSEEIESLRKEVVDLKDRYVRSLAENENVRRRNKKLLDDSKIYAIQSFAKDLLEVADVLEKAIESVPDEEKKASIHLKTLHDGVVMTDVQLQTVFKKHGLLKLNPLDEKFDPNFHEALFQSPIPGKVSGTVAIVEKIGYRLHDRPIRAALVGVVK